MTIKEIVKSGDFIALVCVIVFVVLVAVFVPKIPIKYPEIHTAPIKNMVVNDSYQSQIISVH